MISHIRAMVLFLIAATALALPATAQDKVTVRMLSLPILDAGALFYGIEQGIFAKYGLEIKGATVTGGAVGVPAMIGGEADIIFSSTITAAMARAQKLPVKILAAAAVSLPEVASARDYVAIVTGPNSGIASPRDLAGKKMAVNTLNSVNHLYTMAWLAQQGVDPASVQFVEVSFPAQSAAVMEGRISATMIGAPFLQDMEGRGAKILGWPFRAQPAPVVVASYLTTDQYAQKNPDVVKRFAEALRESIAEIANPVNRQKAIAIFSARTKISEAVIATVTLPTYKTAVDLESLKQTTDLALKYGLMTSAVDLQSLLLETAR